MKLRINLTGKKFGRLLVDEEHGRTKNKQVLWKCVCDCGGIVYLTTACLNSGNTKSCGCLHKEIVAKTFRKHYLKGTPEYTSWQLMKDRCCNVNNKTYQYYGGRGIKVCEQWLDSPEQFVKDMGTKPDKTYTIDRIDCNGNYEPSNCKWASKSEQSRNRNDSKTLTIDGIKKHLADWAADYGMPYLQVYKRIWRGMDPITALTQPLRVR